MSKKDGIIGVKYNTSAFCFIIFPKPKVSLKANGL